MSETKFDNSGPAFPVSVAVDVTGHLYESADVSAIGLTKREYFAALFMQGMLAGPHWSDFAIWTTVERAVKCADVLLEELSK